MKISMGDKQAYGEIGAIEQHFGFPFQIQANRTLVCEVPKNMVDVANQEIKNGRIQLHQELETQRAESDSETEQAPVAKRKIGKTPKPKPRKKEYFPISKAIAEENAEVENDENASENEEASTE